MDGLHAKISGVYDKLNIKQSDWRQMDTVLAGFSGSYLFKGSLMPLLYTNIEYDTAGKVLNNGIAGFSLRPVHWLYWNAEAGHYDTNRDRIRQTIFGLFAIGAFYQGRSGVSITAVESSGALEDLTFTGGYAYQTYHAAPQVKAVGNIADGGVRFTIKPIYLTTLVSYRYYKSFGGKAHDVYIELHDEPFELVNFTAGGNITRYSKITSERGTAISSFLLADLNVTKFLTLSAGGEYLRNITFNHEFRATAKLSFKTSGKI